MAREQTAPNPVSDGLAPGGVAADGFTDGMHGMTLRCVAAVIAVASLTAAVLNSGLMVAWAFELPLEWGPARTVLLQGAEAWHAGMTGLGADRVHAALQDAFSAFRSLPPPGGGA